jgi:hypothetical protein
MDTPLFKQHLGYDVYSPSDNCVLIDSVIECLNEINMYTFVR